MSEKTVEEYKNEIEKLKAELKYLKDELETASFRIQDSVLYANSMSRKNTVLKKRLEDICNIAIGRVLVF